jgi:hypothetical protein
MPGFAAPADYAAIAAQYEASGDRGFDRNDSGEIAAAYDKFLDAYGFRKDYPAASALFQSIGTKGYYACEKLIENCRICDEVDYFVLNGWEESLFDNHSGIVDLHRGFKADPGIISRAMLPEMLVIKARHQVLATGEQAIIDVHLVNETGRKGVHLLSFRATSEDGGMIYESHGEVSVTGGEVYGELLHAGYQFKIPSPGRIKLEASLVPKEPGNNSERLDRKDEIFAVQLAGSPQKQRTVAVAGDRLEEIGRALEAVAGVQSAPFSNTVRPGVILFAAGERNHFPIENIGLVRDGASLVLFSDEEKDLIEAVKQIAPVAGFKFQGAVGAGNLPWMGSWYFSRMHPLFDGLPAGGVMNWEYQIRNENCNGLLIQAPGLDVAAGYGRDHQKTVGIGVCVIPCGKGKIILFSIPGITSGLCGKNSGIHPVAARKLILNAIEY